MKNCLVFLDQGPATASRLEFSLDLAQRLDGHLTAFALSLEPGYMFDGGTLGAQEVWVQSLEAARREADALTERADERLKRLGTPSELRSACLPVDAVARAAATHARYADLSIIGSPRDETEFVVEREVFDGTLFDSGRPVLIAPDRIDSAKVFKRVLIAWDGSKYAARAVGDAMPLIQRAEETAVVIVEPDMSSDAHGEEPGGDIALALSRHGATVDVRRILRLGRTVAEALASHARDWDAGLIVMGGYGHSRFRETLLGGVSRDILTQSEFPLFMSH